MFLRKQYVLACLIFFRVNISSKPFACMNPRHVQFDLKKEELQLNNFYVSEAASNFASLEEDQKWKKKGPRRRDSMILINSIVFSEFHLNKFSHRINQKESKEESNEEDDEENRLPERLS